MGWKYLQTSWEGLPEGLPELTAAGRAVLSQICRFAKDTEEGGGAFFVAQELIARSTGLSISAVQKQVKVLSSSGYVRRIARKKVGMKGCRTMNYYRLLFPVVDIKKDTNPHIVMIGNPHIVRVANPHIVRANRKKGISSNDDIPIEAGACAAVFASREMVEAFAVANGVPDSFVTFFCEKNKDLKAGDEGAVLKWWEREKNKARFLGAASSVSGSESADVQPRRISEDDL